MWKALRFVLSGKKTYLAGLTGVAASLLAVLDILRDMVNNVAGADDWKTLVVLVTGGALSAGLVALRAALSKIVEAVKGAKGGDA